MLKKSASIVLASLRGSTLRKSFSEVGSTVGAIPFAKAHSSGERPTRSAVGTSSPLRSLRPCLRNGASWRAGAGRVRTVAFLSILQECSPGAPHVQNRKSRVLAWLFHSLVGVLVCQHPGSGLGLSCGSGEWGIEISG